MSVHLALLKEENKKQVELEIKLIKISPFLIPEMDYVVKNKSNKNIDFLRFTFDYGFDKSEASLSFYSNPIKPGETRNVTGEILSVDFNETILIVFGWRKSRKSGYIKKNMIKHIKINDVMHTDLDKILNYAQKKSMINRELFDNLVTASALLK